MVYISPAKARARARKRAAARRRREARLRRRITSVIAESKERKGCSAVNVKKALAAKGYDVVKANKSINSALRKMVISGTLSQTTGTGASGSFKLVKKRRKRVGAKRRKAGTRRKKTAAKKRAAKRVRKSRAKKVSLKRSTVKKRTRRAAPKKRKSVMKTHSRVHKRVK